MYNLKKTLKADIGIDIGASNTSIFSQKFGLLLNESSFVATIEKGNSNQVLAIGNSAKIMLGKNPKNIKIFHPLKFGEIASSESVELIISAFLKKAHDLCNLHHQHLILAISPSFTKTEQDTLYEAAISSGMKKVYLIEQPLVTALGFNLPIKSGKGFMIVDIGGGKSTISIIASENIILSLSLKIGGNFLDKKIIEYIRKKHNALIGDNSAELLKIKLASAIPLNQEKKIELKCFDLISGIPRSIIVTSIEIRDIILPYLQTISFKIKHLLEQAPPDVIADIMSRGIFTCGGCTLIQGFSKLISINCGVPTISSNKPLQVNSYGLSNLLQNLPEYTSLLF
ncbi:MAG: rod shape-determining protein [Deltaproteobacteria bacterium]|nr:MAG: rod shape-determining protein [Deltaproteobacteria bacterium]